MKKAERKKEKKYIQFDSPTQPLIQSLFLNSSSSHCDNSFPQTLTAEF